MATSSPKAVLVTGAGRRIGRAIALDLAANGWDVAVHFNASAEEAADVVATITKGGQKAVAIAADLADEAATEALIDRAAEVVGPLTCLINNASVFEEDSVETASRTSWDRHLDVNLRAPFVLTRAFAGQVPVAASGNVINIIDQRVWNLTPHFVSYTLSKSGLWTLTQTLALALAPHIRVNAIGPGPTLASPRQTADQFDRQWSPLPLARATAPDEVAGAVRFILDAPAMTGQMIALDAGQHLGWSPAADGENVIE
jgi:NAD(P)-dependent dehydrogenase (short-subunit alcohol dehydrogenase family)